MTIIVDTREQLPINFKEGTKTMASALNCGDYTTPALRKTFVIERKSPSDLYGTLLADHARFRREILRAFDKRLTLVVFVECSEARFFAKDYEGGAWQNYPAESLRKIIRTVSKKYGIKFYWFEHRAAMANAVVRRLRAEEKKLLKSKTKKSSK